MQSFSQCDLLMLSISDLFKMKLEFPHYFNELFASSRELLRSSLILKLEVIRQSQLILASTVKDKSTMINSCFAFSILGGVIKEI